jgi:triacylglycerol lipase
VARTTHVYLIPGIFGFGRLAGYDYFGHLERELEARFAARGRSLTTHVVSVLATASIKRRSLFLADVLARTGVPGEPIHLIGHSTGGLDGRLLLSPSCQLTLPAGADDFRRQVRSLVSVNAPHYGTPLAYYFTTASGTRLLYALSLLTVTSLSLGRLPLTALASLVSAIGALDERLGIDVKMLDELTAFVLRFMGAEGRAEVHEYLSCVKSDQGGIVQLMPEAMELFNVAVGNAPSVRYGYVATYAPPPASLRLITRIRSPYAALSAAAYSTLYTLMSRPSRAYPLPVHASLPEIMSALLGMATNSAGDGVVPTASMVWGDLVWCGEADHLDIVGHFRQRDLEHPHVDWMTSGARFDRARFSAMCDALVAYMLAAEEADAAPP